MSHKPNKLSNCQNSVIKLPNLDFSLLERSDRLVKQAHLSAKESAKSRRNIPLSARSFNKLKLSDIDGPNNSIPNSVTNKISPMITPSNTIHRKYRMPLSARLPPKMMELNPKPLNTTTDIPHNKLYEGRRRRSSIVHDPKQNHDYILSLLDCRRMEELKHAFMQKKFELDFEEFVSVVWKFMDVKKGKEALAICALLQLFEDIDINDDKKMQWSEFSDFLAASQRHSNDSEIELAKYEVDNFKKPFSLTGRGGSGGGSDIHQLQYSAYYDVIAILMVNSKQITIFNHQKNEILNTIKGHTNCIISCVFLDTFNGIAFPNTTTNDKTYKNMQIIIASSGLDETIIVWLINSTKKKPIPLRIISVNCVHNILYWHEKRKLFVSGDMNNNLYIWDQRMKEITWKNKYHSDMIVDIILAEKTSLLLSASLDTTVVAYDLKYDRIKFKLNIHNRGLISIAYKPSLQCIITCAAEHKIHVSDGIVGRPLAVLQGHSAPLISMISISDSPAVVSLDASNTFKLWDIRKMECIQSIHFGYPLHQISYMLSLLPNHTKIALGSGGMHYLSRKKPAVGSGANAMEIENVCGIFILESKLQILTVHDTMIKKWNYCSGQMVKLIRILPNVLSKRNTITSCTISSTQKLLLIGSSKGLVAIISIYSGGTVMTCLPKHCDSVIFVAFYKTMIISFDCNGSIFKYEGFKYWIEKTKQKQSTNCIEHDALSRSKLVQITNKSEYTVGCIHKIFGILIVGTDDGLLTFFELGRDKIILDINSSNDGITSIILNYNDCKLFTTDKSGNVCCWLLPNQYPSRRQFFCNCLYRIKNCDDLEIPITTFCVKTFGKYIIIGDAKGLIKIWCVNQQEKENESENENNNSKLFNLTEPNGKQYKYECKLMKTIYAASDWINHILIVTDDYDDYDNNEKNDILFIISSSLDGKLCAWKLNGQYIGELIYRKKSKQQWKLEIDIDKKQRKQLTYAYQLFKRMEL